MLLKKREGSKPAGQCEGGKEQSLLKAEVIVPSPPGGSRNSKLHSLGLSPCSTSPAVCPKLVSVRGIFACLVGDLNGALNQTLPLQVHKFLSKNRDQLCPQVLDIFSQSRLKVHDEDLYCRHLTSYSLLSCEKQKDPGQVSENLEKL